MLHYACLIISLIFSVQALAIVNGHEYPFIEGSDIENQSRAMLFRQLAEELRCPKCQNQNLADSNAMIASDLRRELYKQVNEGKQAPDIVEFMVSRYGEFVLYNPKVNDKTWLLWYGPIILFVLALIIFFIIVLKRSKSDSDGISDDRIGAEDLQRVKDLLDQEEK